MTTRPFSYPTLKLEVIIRNAEDTFLVRIDDLGNLQTIYLTLYITLYILVVADVLLQIVVHHYAFSGTSGRRN